MDVDGNPATSSAEVVQRLNAASVPEIRIVSAKLLPEGAENAMASVAAARYFVTFADGRAPAIFREENGRIREALLAFLAKQAIPYVKESKKGTREVDLRAGIFELSWNEEKKGLEMLLDASSGDNVKPSQVLDAFLAQWNEKLIDNSLCITRLDVYTRKPGLEDGPPGAFSPWMR
jgi:radical SAM-linked protein